METKIIINALRECKKPYTVMLDVSAEMIANRLEELEEINEKWCEIEESNKARFAKKDKEISNLKKQLSQKQPEWISVEDERKPKEEDLVFIYPICGTTTIFFYYDKKGFPPFVTHWMKYEPPKPKEPTFKDVFLKKFPKAVTINGRPGFCILTVFPYLPECTESIGDKERCIRCWNQPYFEEEGEADA